MNRPALIVIDDDDQRLELVTDALSRRYGHDYNVATQATTSGALRLLKDLRDAESAVALIIVAVSARATANRELLANARKLHPAARRVLLVARGGPDAPSLRVPTSLLQDHSIAQPILNAVALGLVDSYLPAPGFPSDEAFHRAVTELLEEWSQIATPARPAIRIIGDDRSRRSHELRDLLGRNGIPYIFLSAESDEGRRWLDRAKAPGAALPRVMLYDGRNLVDPANDEIASALGLGDLPSSAVDVAIIGAGPAGLSAAVYTASEGLSTLLLEREAIGGQAGSSARIRNYLGFPRGLSGANLATRAFEQAWSFGAITSLAGPATALTHTAEAFTIDLATDKQVQANTVVIATGVSYRKLSAPGVERLVGAGVFYGASTSEARAFTGQSVFIAGAANSAGQAAINFARHAKQVTILARGDSLATRMSQYLIDEIKATANIEIRTNTEVLEANGDGTLETLTLTNRVTGSTDTVPATALVVLIGAAPHTDWLPEAIARDEHGFIITGDDLSAPADYEHTRQASHVVLPFETSMPGVFAAGDVRHRSIKRVAAAVGEGAIAASAVVQHLHTRTTPAARR
jgi:thioredoxin reductase (NADPH)